MNLVEPRQNLELTLQAYADLNFLLDPQGVILEYKSGPFLAGEFPEITRSLKIQDLLPPESADRFERALQSVRQTGRVNSFEYVVPIADREHWFDARLIPISKSRIIFTARDITKCRETEMRMQRQIQQLSALRSIDLAIASGLELNLLLSMLLDQVTTLTGINAASILLLNPKTNLLEFAAGKGFHSSILQYTRLKLGDGCAGRVALERKMFHIADLLENKAEFDRSPLFRSEQFVVYYGVPLLAKGRILGVLEMFHRSPLHPDADWLDFLGMVAGQAAIAIDSAMMFKELQISNVELGMAYDATIEGLSRALDLRDRETKEHTHRVADITMRFASRLGVEGSDLVHIRRGAILHDIGKVAIPDHILFKPGPLSDEEWKIMRQHPDIAVDLLSPVAYLAQALDIPHWHHERWDGTGYPDHLAGDRIPFPARLFTLVDVYDALTSNRPYRAAWQKQDAVQYIESQSGKYFDPRIVPIFLHMVNEIRV